MSDPRSDEIDGTDAAVPFEAGIDTADRVADARRRHGRGGAMLAAGMLGLDQILTSKPKQDAPIVIAANSDPLDIDTDGIRAPLGDDAEIVAPPLPRTPPLAAPSRKGRRRR